MRKRIGLIASAPVLVLLTACGSSPVAQAKPTVVMSSPARHSSPSPVLHMVTMPEVRGRTAADAFNLLRRAHITNVNLVDDRKDAGNNNITGYVVAQSPGGGSLVSTVDSVELTISSKRP